MRTASAKNARTLPDNSFRFINKVALCEGEAKIFPRGISRLVSHFTCLRREQRWIPDTAEDVMNATEIQERLSALQADGQAIQAALGGMEATFAEWFTAMSGVHDLLAKAAAHTDKGRRSLITTGAQSPLEAPVAEKAAHKPASAVSAPPLVSQSQPAQPAAVELSAEEQEERALLDSLEPEIARQVHVRRRLSGHSKSVRELVDEIRAEKGSKGAAPPPDKQQKKGWWS